MKVLFLDHFGVMCLAHKHGQERLKDDYPSPTELYLRKPFEPFDKNAILLLNSIIRETDVEIVISSDWKLHKPLEYTQQFYLEQGVVKPPISYTPNINYPLFREKRSLEILQWLKDNPITSWVCVDDLHLPNLHNFVWITKSDEGLTQSNKQREIITLLSNQVL